MPSEQSNGTRLEQFADRMTRTTTWKLTLTEFDAIRFERERLDMIEDAMFLIRQALIGNTEGPLTLPRTGIPAR